MAKVPKKDKAIILMIKRKKEIIDEIRKYPRYAVDLDIYPEYAIPSRKSLWKLTERELRTKLNRLEYAFKLRKVF